MRFLALLFCVATSLPLHAGTLETYLRDTGMAPADYVLQRLERHPLVILGEGHWGRDDAELVSSLVPKLHQRGVALGIEWMSAKRQGDVDRLIAGTEWNRSLANDLMKSADWPYLQYREIFHRAWESTHAHPELPAMQIVALGPPPDWRKAGIDYDAFMASRVAEYSGDQRRPMLVYCGMHHAFTRYLQVNRSRNGRVAQFMDRMGNILWRQFGEDVFLIALEKPEMCGPRGEEETRYCLPLSGIIDCAAASAGRPVGFDLAASPIAEMHLPASSFYAAGHPFVRIIDFADGWIWQGPVDRLKLVEMIPFEELSNDPSNDAGARKAWEKEREWLAHPMQRSAWRDLAKWRSNCGAQ
ncbi:MAG: ChaN family lipoprotein [Thermoanaerobaculia bacterium]